MISRFFDYHNPWCDGCGTCLGAERSDEAAEAAMRAAGWAKIKDNDFCPLCQRKAQETGKLPEPMRFWEFTKHMRKGN